MRIPAYLVIAFLFLCGCAAPGPLLQTADSDYYEAKDHRLLRVSEGGEVYDISCVGLEWFQSHWHQTTNRKDREKACDKLKIGEAERESGSRDWNMIPYQIQPVCQPLEFMIDPARRLFGWRWGAVPYSCWNRAWEVPFAPVMVVLLYLRLPLFYVYGYLGG